MSALWQNKQAATAAAEKLKIFAQPQRLMIISALLAHGELAVSAIDDATGIGQPALSQQLAELRKAHLVETRREAKLVYYRLADDLISLCARSIETVFGQPPLPPPNPISTMPKTNRTAGAAAFAKIIGPAPQSE